MQHRTTAGIEKPGRSNVLPALAVVCLLSGVVLAGSKGENDEAVATMNLVWPQPPQQARVTFLMQIRGVEDVTVRPKTNWMDRMAGSRKKAPSLQLGRPYGVAADSVGKIYVADPANRMVFVFDVDHRHVEYRGNRAPAQMALPVGVAVDERDRLFVSDAHFHQVTCFSPEGNVLAVFGTKELQRPAGLAVDVARHRLFVADAQRHRVAVFDTNTFRLLGYVGSPSTPRHPESGKFATPTNVAVDARGFLYVTDSWNYRIQVFDTQGKFVRAFGEQGRGPGTFLRPKGIALDSEGHVYVADSDFNNFQILTPEGGPLLAVGSYGLDPGQFTLIAGIFIDRKDRIYVTDQWQGRVQVFQYLPEQIAASPKGAAERR